MGPSTSSAQRCAFLSTLPARGATQHPGDVAVNVSLFLSTLPARGATGPTRWTKSGRANFYPRSPRGERPRTANIVQEDNTIFLSTLPARGATCRKAGLDPDIQFLSTLPARGATC